MKVLLDAGHGGNEPGAVNKETGIEEEDINLNVVFKIGNILRAKGFDVLYTRDKDTYISPTDRLKMITAYNPDCFLSVHCNSSTTPSATGVETVYRDDGDYKLAKIMHQKLLSAFPGLKDRGLKRDGSPEYNRGLAVLKNLKVPSCLIELPFLSNLKDLHLIDDENETNAIARVLAGGIEEFKEAMA